MAQSNLAREPSMDEILASIRKIIESNEATGPGLPANDQGPLSDSFYADRAYLDDEEAEDIQLTIDDTVFPDFDHDEDRQPAPAIATVAAEPPRIVSPAPLSLADVAARVRAASERQSMPRDTGVRDTAVREVAVPEAPVQQAPVHQTPVYQAPAYPAAVPEVQTRDNRLRELEAYATVDQPAPRRSTSDVFPHVEAAISHRSEEPASPVRRADVAAEFATERLPASVAPEPRVSAPQPVEPVDVAVAPLAMVAPEKDVTAILSDAVSEQVSRSFSELALALDSSPRRSFDEIAEDMLRPMLQEWMDDNLPTLVERLVREEIERVARGPRR